MKKIDLLMTVLVTLALAGALALQAQAARVSHADSDSTLNATNKFFVIVR